ncbi:hypothetical protein VCRA2130O400_800018 [Vibrio crassostreae]|nr:hypothetical protein VCRA2119O382_40117 [Vibrio crassostreae]CAK2507425.1 hypothetical protein VCRA2113O350_40116 [Vibrio crassostreae]CAK2526801.1 hypothetical protein VCRA2113O360_50219 [Vibrio crassostreae]CAK2976796.1 hypothetical protein VCRA2119O385_60066 [Vibrio crassostreae]CAK3464233.1 hypothetical protein VCRA2123O396_40271 [Vibrio crassostreae]
MYVLFSLKAQYRQSKYTFFTALNKQNDTLLKLKQSRIQSLF